ncbi:glycosyltransferase family 4 protein [Flagellimonas marinaquae]
MKRILIDINAGIKRRGETHVHGIGRTVHLLLKGLQGINDNYLDISTYSQGLYTRPGLQKSGLRSFHVPIPSGRRYKKLISSMRLKEFLFSYDALHIPHNFDWVAKPDNTLVTIHDAMFFSFPENFSGQDFARKYYPKLAQNCRAIITCSVTSKQDIVTHLEVPDEKVTVVPWAVDKDIFYPPKKRILDQALGKLNISYPYFVMVSCNVGRKNTINGMRAFRQYLTSRSSHKLILVWTSPPNAYVKEFAKEIESGQIIIFNGVGNDTLRFLYAGATASFFPSRYEGFGLPVLESMACGTPVVTCPNSSLLEVGGDAAVYVDPDDVKGMSDVMVAFDEASMNRDQLVKKCLQQSANFSLEQMTKGYVDFYKNNA